MMYPLPGMSSRNIQGVKDDRKLSRRKIDLILRQKY